MINKIKNAINIFELDIKNRVVLTEGATGNYVSTPIIAALGGAKKVYSYAKESKHGTVNDIKKQTLGLSKMCGVENTIEIVTTLDNVNLKEVDILTNTGFLRPINKKIINSLKKDCVIPLMWETWEFRDSDLDIEACHHRGIKVYGTNEDDKRLKTKQYIGYMVLYFLLNLKHTPMSSNILILGCDYFTSYAKDVLEQNNYKFDILSKYDNKIDVKKYNAIVLLEHNKKDLLIGKNGFIKTDDISSMVDVIHICGNVDLAGADFRYVPDKPADFGYMSYTADYMGSQVVVDLHTAGFKVAEGMLKANKMGLNGKMYKDFMEKNYPALSFGDERLW